MVRRLPLLCLLIAGCGGLYDFGGADQELTKTINNSLKTIDPPEDDEKDVRRFTSYQAQAIEKALKRVGQTSGPMHEIFQQNRARIHAVTVGPYQAVLMISHKPEEPPSHRLVAFVKRVAGGLDTPVQIEVLVTPKDSEEAKAVHEANREYYKDAIERMKEFEEAAKEASP